MTIEKSHYAARKVIYENRTYLYVGRDYFLVEQTGEVKSVSELGEYLLKWTGNGSPPMICTNDAAGIIKRLDDELEGHPTWTWRATPLRRVKRSAHKPRESKPAISVKLNPLYCGFRRPNGHTANRYFHFIDCNSITGKTSQAHYGGSELESLENFGVAYREFSRAHGVQCAGTRGKFGGAMLRDPRYIGTSERRIPGFINREVREHLPGNHYELRAETDTPLEGIYLDITAAHHTAAVRTDFPNPAGLRARGHWEIPPTTVSGREPWAKANTDKFDRILRTHGLVLLRTEFQGVPKRAILHPAAQSATTTRPNLVYAFTNELQLVKDSGFTIEGIEAAWTSGTTSRALNSYAEDSIRVLASASKDDRPWMKSLLLSTYGMLGKKPSKYQSVSNSGGKNFDWPTSEGFLTAGLKSTIQEHSPVTTNVIALGMIQAETRRNVIETAKWLESIGIRVLALYADSIIVSATDRKGLPTQLPFLPTEWRVKTLLTHLRFLNTVSWVSDQEERLPGIGRETALRESRRRAIHAHARVTGPDPAEWLLKQAEVAGVGGNKVR